MSNKSRSIFEDVQGDKVEAATPKGGMIDGPKGSSRGLIAIWLLVLFAMVVLMILVGGLTRLTDSGLSITEWKPIMGAIPPMSDAAWQAEFVKYQATPEFKLVNASMDLSDFKFIYWWEWGHRQLGRAVGLVWAIGFFGFLALGRIPRGWIGRLAFVGVLGGLQGAVGWWMVSSGLTGRMVDVASYRLAIHLGLAFVILMVLAWYYWQMRREEMELFQARRQKDSQLIRWGRILLAVVFVQVLLGALVAGIDAGRGYIDWPLMNGAFLPSESFDYTPVWTNFFENPALVQFNHRMVGYLCVILGGAVWYVSRGSGQRRTKQIFSWVAVAIFGQMVLGIATVLYAAPLQIAIVHQLGAIAVVVLALRAVFLATYPMAQGLR